MINKKRTTSKTGKQQYRQHIRQAWQNKPWHERPKQYSNDFLHGWNRTEEIINSITHGLGALLGVVALVLLVFTAEAHDTFWSLIGGTIFGASLIAAFSISTFYHALLYPPTKHLFKILDHCSIFILIAGTYTPFCLVTLHGRLGWIALTVIWVCALLGIGLKCLYINRFKYVSLALYLLMGWFAVVASYQLVQNLPTGGLVLLLVGGLFYTFGVIFFFFEQVPFFHTIWHLFVLGGAMSHFIAIFLYVMPVSVAIS